MIVSYKHKFIFFALPKTASQSIRVALRPHMHSHDWEQCTLYEKKFFPVKEFRKINHGHISYDQLSKYLIPNILSDLFKFTFVRNPYDRFVSICCFRNWNNDSMISHPLDTMKRIIQSKEVESTLIYDPQYKFVTDDNGKINLDFIGRYENLESDFESLCETLSLPNTTLEVTNNTIHPPYREMYDTELEEMVYEYYKRDFVTFDYKRMLS